MGWNKDGSTIKAEYLTYPVVGVVEESRVKYGGTVQYRVRLNEPLFLPWSSEQTDIVLVDEDEVLADFGVMENVNG